MSIAAIPNQPVQFDVNPSSCSVANRPYLQLIDIEDTTQIQFDITPCLFSYNVVLNGGFSDSSNWVTTDSFTINNGLACKAAGGIGTIQQYNIFQIGLYYQIQILVDSANEQMQVWNGNTQIGTITGIGNFVFSFQAVSDSISIRSFSTTNVACISSISGYEIDSRLIMAIFDGSGAYVDSFTLLDNPEYFRLSESKLTVDIVWEDFLSASDTGCYYLGIADPCINTNGQNGIFNPYMNANGEPDSGGFTVSVGANADLLFGAFSYGMFYRATAGGVGGTATLTDPYSQFTTGISYDYAIQFSPLSGSNSANLTIDIGGNSDVNLATVGSLITGTIVCGAGNAFSIELVPFVTPTVLFIESIIVTLSDLNDLSPDSESVQFKRGTFDCSVLLNSNCNEDVMGFEYEQSLFNPRVRLEGELVNPTYPGQRTIFENSRGNRKVVYGERSKAKTLKLDLQPEYMLDYLSTLPYVDNLWIDGIKYTVQEDELEPEYPNELVGHGKITMSLIEDGATIYNRNVSDVENGSQLDLGFFVVDPRQDDLIITEPDTGDTVRAL